MVMQAKISVNNPLFGKVMKDSRLSLPTNIPPKPNFREYYQNFEAHS